jgi:5-(aminomethyl)-3-furanmethanol phosphate kinase
MKVVKVGGSLEHCSNLKTYLTKIDEHYPSGLIIVPGGGVFADTVRQAQQRWHFDDDCAHRMAIIAMQQMALLFQSILSGFKIADNLKEINERSGNGERLIWWPDVKLLEKAGIAAIWDVTSDSLAAWLAGALNADELILVKSAELTAGLDLPALTRLGIVDPRFIEFTKNAAYRITLINKDAL